MHINITFYAIYVSIVENVNHIIIDNDLSRLGIFVFIRLPMTMAPPMNFSKLTFHVPLDSHQFLSQIIPLR